MDRIDGAFNSDELEHWFNQLAACTFWSRPYSTRTGKRIPRKAAWLVQDTCCECLYEYGGIEWPPIHFDALLIHITQTVLTRLGLEGRYNCCNLNMYESGRDSVTWHSDNEHLFGYHGESVDILSLSLGASRGFSVRSIHGSYSDTQVLHDGTALRMYGKFQSQFEHAVFKSLEATDRRINLTWRFIRNHCTVCSLRSGPIRGGSSGNGNGDADDAADADHSNPRGSYISGRRG